MPHNTLFLIVGILCFSFIAHTSHDDGRAVPMNVDQAPLIGTRRTATTAPQDEPPAKRQKTNADATNKNLEEIIENISQEWEKSQREEIQKYNKSKKLTKKHYNARRNMLMNAVEKYNIDLSKFVALETISDNYPRLCRPLIEAMIRNDISFAEFLLEHNTTPLLSFLEETKTKQMAELLFPYVKTYQTQLSQHPIAIEAFNTSISDMLHTVCSSKKYETSLIEFYLAKGADIKALYGVSRIATLLHTLIWDHEISDDPQDPIYAKAAILVDAGVPLDAKMTHRSFAGVFQHTWQTLLKKKIIESVGNKRLAYRRLERVILDAIDAKENRTHVAKQYLTDNVITLPTALIALAMAYLSERESLGNK